MFSGHAARSFTLAVVLAQVVVSVVLAAVIPAPQSMARQSSIQVDWEPSDIMQAASMPQLDAAENDVVQPSDDQAAVLCESGQEDWGALAYGESFHEWLSGDAGAYTAGSGVGGGDYEGSDYERVDYEGRYSSGQLREQGVIYDNGVRYTWYSQRVLPGGGLAIEGRHVSDEGYVVDSQGRIVVASSDLPQGSEVSVPFGGGIAVVLDSGCAPGTIDVYTDF